MKLASHIAISRHGIYYFRLTYGSGDTTKEKRISLRTKNPQEARLKASCLSAIIVTSKHDRQKAMERDTYNAAQGLATDEPADSNFLGRLLQRFDRQQLAQLTGRSQADIESLLNRLHQPNVRKLELELPGGLVFRDINSDEDVGRVHQILKALNLSPESLAQLIAGPNPQRVSSPPPQNDAMEATIGVSGSGVARILQPPVNHAKPATVEAGGTTIQEMVPRYATRKKKKLAVKTHLEYGNYHRKFVEWLEVRKKSNHIPVHSITRADVSDYIDELLNEGISEQTVTKKYLPALTGVFDLAQTMGVIPEGQTLVTRGHKVMSKADIKKVSAANGFKSFTDDELKTIFHPLFLKDSEKPVDFWAPLLGLFTGARLNELCQLDIKDIQKRDDIWAIHFIDDEPDKSLKTPAARRWIPLHPTLIEMGFLDYVKDASQCTDGRKLFPYLSYSPVDGYAGTPSERWGKYLDTIDIKDPQKVFHSFRSTANDRLKQNGVPEESRCQFVGHEHDTVNSTTYSNEFNLQFLLDNVASKLNYPSIDFSGIKYVPGQFSDLLRHLCAAKERRLSHNRAKALRLAQVKKK